MRVGQTVLHLLDRLWEEAVIFFVLAGGAYGLGERDPYRKNSSRWTLHADSETRARYSGGISTSIQGLNQSDQFLLYRLLQLHKLDAHAWK